MSYITEFLRSLSDSLGLQARIMFFHLPKECNANYDLARERLPSAYFSEVGVCKSTGSYSLTNEMMNNAADNARPFGGHRAYFVFSVPDTTDYSDQALAALRYLIQVCHVNTYRPVVITAGYDNFLRDTNLTYDDAIIISQKAFSKYYYNKILDTIEQKLLPKEQYELSMGELNEQINACPANISQPLVFSRPYVNAMDIVVMLFLIYSLYSFAFYRPKSPKLKKG